MMLKRGVIFVINGMSKSVHNVRNTLLWQSVQIVTETVNT